jgi:hypothetical protein
MHMNQPTVLTNYPDWYHDIGGHDHSVALWVTFHEHQWELEELLGMPWWDRVQKIFIIGGESHSSHWTQQDPRIWVWDSRYLPQQPRFFSFFWWWWQTIEVERHQNATAKLLDPRLARPRYHFDFLAGSPKAHRKFVQDAIRECPVLSDRCLWSPSWIAGTETEIAHWGPHHRDSCSRLPFWKGQTANVACFVPYLIFNQSWFSLLTESRLDHNFFTEKTAKMFLARRVFVAFGAVNLLQELRAMGFQTFSSVIDESYDSVTDDVLRWQMAIDQARQVCRQDPQQIYNKLLPVLEHNRQHLLQEDLVFKAKQQMIAVLHDK